MQSFRRVGRRYSRNSSKGNIHSIYIRSTAMLHYTPVHGVSSLTGLVTAARTAYAGTEGCYEMLVFFLFYFFI